MIIIINSHLVPTPFPWCESPEFSRRGRLLPRPDHLASNPQLRLLHSRPFVANVPCSPENITDAARDGEVLDAAVARGLEERYCREGLERLDAARNVLFPRLDGVGRVHPAAPHAGRHCVRQLAVCESTAGEQQLAPRALPLEHTAVLGQ